ncbi:MAG: NAD-binding protein [Odoribacter splanchnicus]
MYVSNKIITTFIIVISTIALVCGIYGYYISGIPHFDDMVYKTLKLFVLNDDSISSNCIYINIARFLAPLAVMLGGAQALVYLSKNGFNTIVRMCMKNHTVICGLRTTGLAYYKNLVKEKPHGRFMLLDLAPTPNIFGSNTFVTTGDATNLRTLSQLKLSKAEKLYILTGSDYINLVILDNVRAFNHLEIYLRLENKEMKDILTETQSLNFKKFKIINLSENIATQFTGIVQSTVIILGFGSIGQLILKNLYEQNGKIIVIEQSKNTVARFVTNNHMRYQTVKFITTDIIGIIKNDLKDILENPDDHVVIFVCMGGDWAGFTTAVRWKLWNKNARVILIGNHIYPEHFLLKKLNIETRNIIKDGIGQQ